MSRIDRLFVTTDWGMTFPLARVQGLCKQGSDHVPLVVNLGVNDSFGKKKFRFEKWWLERDDFKPLIVKAWSTHCNESNPLDVWQFRIRTLRRLVRGWAANVTAALNREKKDIANEYSILDIESESRVLSSQETERMNCMAKDMNRLWALDEMRARQRSRDRSILEGDRNTTYFQVVANQRNRKKRTDVLDGPSGHVQDSKGMMDIAVYFYKKLFKKEDRGNVSLGNNFWDDEEKVTPEENEELEASFSEEEIKAAVFSCYPEGAPGPDGLPFLFYQKCWEVIKTDLLNMFACLQNGNLALHRLNFATLTSIPKENEARSMKKFRPISLLNCSFKIFSKVLTIRLSKVC